MATPRPPPPIWAYSHYYVGHVEWGVMSRRHRSVISFKVDFLDLRYPEPGPQAEGPGWGLGPMSSKRIDLERVRPI